MTKAASLECDCCGACCRTFPVLVSADDANREPRILTEAREIPEWQRTASWRYQLHPLPFHQGCCFLQEDCRCSVYSTRPKVCRVFAAGSDECIEARERVGLSPLS